MSDLAPAQTALDQVDGALRTRDADAVERVASAVHRAFAAADRGPFFEPDGARTMRRDFARRGNDVGAQLDAVVRALRHGEAPADAIVARAYAASERLRQSLTGVVCNNYN